MLCESCQKNEATVHLTQVVEETVKKVHLCEACAAKSGLDLHAPLSISDLLMGLGKAAEPEPDGSEKACPRCHMRPSDYKKTGRLGCPDCYEAFAAALAPLIKGMHRHEQHVGKVPSGTMPPAVPAAAKDERTALERQLAKAIEDENYEEAAQLRDRLQEAVRPPRKKSSS